MLRTFLIRTFRRGRCIVCLASAEYQMDANRIWWCDSHKPKDIPIYRETFLSYWAYKLKWRWMLLTGKVKKTGYQEWTFYT